MKKLTEYILVRMEPTIRSIELDGYDNTIEDFKRQLDIVISDYKKDVDQKGYVRKKRHNLT